MPTTLTKGATVLSLPDDMAWPDEFAWSAMAEQRAYSLGGALLRDVAMKLAGRPITLQGGPNHAWMTRADALTLKSWADADGGNMTLALRGASYDVVFDLAADPVTVTPIIDYSDPSSTDLCWVVLRLITTE
jgi:hypothetical protein